MTSDELLPGDILLYRGQSPVGRFICLWTRSDYCHAAMIGFGRQGQVLEMYDLKGGKASELESLAGQDVDVFRLIDDPDGISANAAAKMVKAVSAGYSLRHAILAGLYSFFQFMARPTQKECNRHGLHCSQAVSLAYRESGFDLWPAAPDWATLPEHLARSPYLVNLGKLEF